jgi:hypothetical protein
MFDWTDLTDLLPWRVQLGCLIFIIAVIVAVMLWTHS